MNKLDYSSDSQDSDFEPPATTIKRHKPSSSSPSALPPLPDSILDKYQHLPPTKDSRMMLKYNVLRNIPPGMVNCYTYAEFIPTLNQCDALQELTRNINMVLKYSQRSRPSSIIPIFTNDLRLTLPLHVSLTDNFYLPRDLKDEFKNQLNQRINEQFSLKSGNPLSRQSTKLTFDKVLIVPNNNATSAFAALSLDKNSQARINPLFQLIQDVMSNLIATSGVEKVFSGPEVSNSNQLHVSIGTCESPFLYKMDDLDELNELCEDLEVDQSIEFSYDTIKVIEPSFLGRFSLKLY